MHSIYVKRSRREGRLQREEPLGLSWKLQTDKSAMPSSVNFLTGISSEPGEKKNQQTETSQLEMRKEIHAMQRVFFLAATKYMGPSLFF